MNYFVSKNGQQMGPYTVEQIRQFVDSGQISPSDFVCEMGGAQWSPISSIFPAGPPISNNKSSGVGIVVGICVGIMLLLGGGGLAIFFYLEKNEPTNEPVPKENFADLGQNQSVGPNSEKPEKSNLDINNALAEAKDFSTQRLHWIRIIQEMQNVFTEVTTNGVYIVTKPNQLVVGTNTAAQVQADLAIQGTPPAGLTNAITAIWIESLTTTHPATVDGAGGMNGGGIQAGSGGTDQPAQDVEYLYLNLKAKNILPRQRENLNREFAELVAQRFRSSPLFSGSEEDTKITSRIRPTAVFDRWFTFQMELKLATPIRLKTDEEMYGELGPHLRQLIPKEMGSPETVSSHADFSRHLVEVIDELNQRAREANVGVITNSTNATVKIPYNFTFAYLRSSPQLSRDKLPILNEQLRDIHAISGVLFQSGIQSITSIKRTRVCNEDFAARAGPQYLDSRIVYTNELASVHPYQVNFRSLSGNLARVLNGLAMETNNLMVVRKMEIRDPDAKQTPGMGGGGMSSGRFPGAGNPPGGGFGSPPGGGSGFPGFGGPPEGGNSPSSRILAPSYLNALIQMGYGTQGVTNVINESIFEVELEIDVLRRAATVNEPAPTPLEQPVAEELRKIITAFQQKPPALRMEGKQHLVFNPKTWMDVSPTNGAPPIMLREDAKYRIGISSLYVTNIIPVRTVITPKADISNGKLIYKFNNIDNYPATYPVFSGAQSAYNRIRTFMPHRLQAPRPFEKPLTLQANRGPVDLHWFANNRIVINRHPDWAIKVDFKNVYQTRNAQDVTKIDIQFDLDIIFRDAAGISMTNAYKRIPANRPIPIDRAFQADFLYSPSIPEVKPKAFSNYRQTRHLLINGDILQVAKVTPTEVTLWSDPSYGGNGKRYVKKLISPLELQRILRGRSPKRKNKVPSG